MYGPGSTGVGQQIRRTGTLSEHDSGTSPCKVTRSPCTHGPGHDLPKGTEDGGPRFARPLTPILRRTYLHPP